MLSHPAITHIAIFFLETYKDVKKIRHTDQSSLFANSILQYNRLLQTLNDNKSKLFTGGLDNETLRFIQNRNINNYAVSIDSPETIPTPIDLALLYKHIIFQESFLDKLDELQEGLSDRTIFFSDTLGDYIAPLKPVSQRTIISLTKAALCSFTDDQSRQIKALSYPPLTRARASQIDFILDSNYYGLYYEGIEETITASIILAYKKTATKEELRLATPQKPKPSTPLPYKEIIHPNKISQNILSSIINGITGEPLIPFVLDLLTAKLSPKDDDILVELGKTLMKLCQNIYITNQHIQKCSHMYATLFLKSSSITPQNAKSEFIAHIRKTCGMGSKSSPNYVDGIMVLHNLITDYEQLSTECTELRKKLSDRSIQRFNDGDVMGPNLQSIVLHDIGEMKDLAYTSLNPSRELVSISAQCRAFSLYHPIVLSKFDDMIRNKGINIPKDHSPTEFMRKKIFKLIKETVKKTPPDQLPRTQLTPSEFLHNSPLLKRYSDEEHSSKSPDYTDISSEDILPPLHKADEACCIQ